MPRILDQLEEVDIEPYNLGRFAVQCHKAGYDTLTFKVKSMYIDDSDPFWELRCWFTPVSGVPFEVAAEIARKLPSRRDESKSDKPDPNVDNEGKTPKDGGEREK